MLTDEPGHIAAAAEDRNLADVYADRHERLDRFIVMYAIPEYAFARIGIKLHSPVGYVLLFGVLLAGIFLPALGIGIITGDSAAGFAVHALVVAAALAALNVAALMLAQAAAYNISGVHRALTDNDQIRELIDWDRRWYSPTASAVVGGSFALAFLGALYVLSSSISGVPLRLATIWFAFVVALFLGQFTFSIGMIFFEFRYFTNCRFSLYILRPTETQALQKTASGLKQLGIVSIVLFPLFNLVLLSVLPDESSLNVIVTVGFLLFAYVATGVGILFPLHFLGSIVKREKERHLRPLERELNAMVPRLAQLADAEYEKFRRLEALRNLIGDSADGFLSLGSVARIVGAAVLSTVTVVATAAIQIYLERAV